MSFQSCRNSYAVIFDVLKSICEIDFLINDWIVLTVYVLRLKCVTGRGHAVNACVHHEKSNSSGFNVRSYKLRLCRYLYPLLLWIISYEGIPHFRESQRNLNFEKILKIMEFTADLIANYIRTGCSLLLLFIVLVMRDRNKFITLHTLLHLGFGIGFAFFPHICYGIQVCAFITIISLSYMLHYQKSTG